ncbi:MAG: carbon monoxide dehydrogenase [Alphaproteobacteria bacterium]|nr:carbon monoxide dehydrogenase [Alphaproteobacteria bacterium]
MDMTGEYRIPAPREAVWKALNDPDVLKQCIPGCEELEKKSDTEFAAKVTAKVGPVKAKFGGNVKMSDLDPPNGYTISGEGSGGAAGFAKGGAKVALKDDGGATVLSYTVNATVGGKLAQIGSRLIDSTAKKMANDFFGKFAEIVGGDGAAAAPDAPAAPSAEAPPTAGPTAALEAGRPAASTPEPVVKKGLPVTVWVGGVIVALGILMWLFA